GGGGRGERTGGVGWGGPPTLGLRHTLERVRVDLGAGAVPGELEPEPAELAVPVVGAGVVAEGRRPGPATVDAGVEDVAARDPLLHELREQTGQPRAAGPDDDIRPRSVGRRGVPRLHAQPARERPRREPRPEHARPGLEQRRAQVVDAERWEEPLRLLGRQALARDLEPPERPLAPPCEVVVARLEPREADGLEQLHARLRLDLPPELERPPYRQRVPLRVAV